VIPLLAPIFQGPWAAYGETLQCSSQRPADSVVLADLLRQPGLLTEVLRRFARHLASADPDLRAVASAWSLEYLSALLPPVVAAASLLQHRFDVGLEHIAVRFDEQGEATGFHLTDEGRALPGGSTHARFESLLHGHLEPLFAALHQHTRLAPKILWGNTARHLDAIFDQALEVIGPLAALVEDRAALLERPTWPGARDNPMHVRQRRVAHHASGAITLYRQCCLLYRLPGEGYCGPCPLDPRHRPACRRTAAADAPA
jgi:ferric iron reductase protein FhuF